MAIRTIRTTFMVFVCCSIAMGQVYAQNEDSDNVPSAVTNLNKQEEQAIQKQKYMERKAKEETRQEIETELALMRARLEKEMAGLRAEIERLRLEREATALRWEIEQDKAQKDHEKQMVELNRQRERLAAELAISQAK